MSDYLLAYFWLVACLLEFGFGMMFGFGLAAMFFLHRRREVKT